MTEWRDKASPMFVWFHDAIRDYLDSEVVRIGKSRLLTEGQPGRNERERMGQGEVGVMEFVYRGTDVLVAPGGKYLVNACHEDTQEGNLQRALAELAREYAILHSYYNADPVVKSPPEPPIIDTYTDNCGIEWIVRSDATWRTSTGKDDSRDFKPHWNEPTTWSRWLVDKHNRAKKAQERN